MKHTDDICDDVDKTTDLWVPKINNDYWRYEAYSHTLIQRSFKHGFEKSQAYACEERKMHFCTPMRVFAHAHLITKLDSIMQKDRSSFR